MSKIVLIAAAALVFGTVVPAVADDSEPQCAAAAAAQTVSADAIQAELEDAGYRIDEIELEDGCYKFEVMNESGYPVKAVYQPSTGELLRAELD